MAPCFFIYIFLFFLYNKKNVSSLSLCIHVACVNKQMGREKKTKESIARMCIKKNEQNGTNTRIHSMRHKIERQTEKKTEDVV
jgi:hypothetical protein